MRTATVRLLVVDDKRKAQQVAKIPIIWKTAVLRKVNPRNFELEAHIMDGQ